MTLKEACKDKNNNLNFIRFIASILVLYMHSFAICVGDVSGDLIGHLTMGKEYAGGLAVDIFFIISGFLICKSYDNKKSVFGYFKARFLRIWPLLFVVVILLTFVVGPMVTTYKVSHYFELKPYWLYFLRNLYFVSAYTQLPGVFMNHFSSSVDGSLWTLLYEVICYFFVAITAFIWKRKRSFVPIVWGLCSLVYLFHNYFCAFPIGPISANFIQNMSRFGVYFLVGMSFYLYRDILIVGVRTFLVGLFLTVIGILWLDFTILFALGGALMIFSFGYSKRITTSWYNKIGDLSYGIYLLSFPIQQLVISWLGKPKQKLFLEMNPYINMIISLVIVLPLAYLSWRFIESPMLKLKDKSFFRSSRKEV